MKRDGIAMQIWNILYPLLFYYAVMLIVMAVAQQIFGSDHEHYVISQLISTLATLPCMWPFYRQDEALRGIQKEHFSIKREHLFHGLWALAIVACLSVAANNLISMTPLVELSAGFKEANAGFYGSTLALELVSSAVATPILEELVFRGIIFGRLRNQLPKAAAVVVSALLFALVHFNIVQFLYALIIGAVLALLMDRAGLYVAVLGHIAANAIAVLRTETGILAWSVDKSVLAWVSSVVVLAVGTGLLGAYLYKYKDSVKNRIY
ncbi:MAG: CPBP family intramembrane metalloprotease [Muribaculaceae bacterium]|nr:CPBP family intramembrane metalloprotease [Roseburia sp.]MCM1431246.1 CPBP family intramembrane metalloprotease [Muribaculaceae bacterium]MCM1492268.1 CPBP family intramembrane metalloprotease [Muribaculaceae bacterium]